MREHLTSFPSPLISSSKNLRSINCENMSEVRATAPNVFEYSTLPPSTNVCQPIRLLELLPSRRSSQKIRCTLRQVNLLDKLNFKALSYVWGDPNVTLTIFVDEKPHQVTTNCHAALLTLRQTRERFLWIDAICINQKDNAEKMSQVLLMSDIYSSANEVIVWLGHGEHERRPDDIVNERLALNLMCEMQEAGKAGLNLEAVASIAENGNDRARQWNAVSWMMSHEWFRRLWVIQEVAVAKASIARTQYHRFPFLLMVAAATMFSRILSPPITTRKRFSFLEADELTILFNRCVGASIHYALLGKPGLDGQEGRGKHLLAVLRRTMLHKCFDPRDRIFAILALLGNGTKDWLRVDYGQSVTELYIYLTSVIIQDTQDLKVLGMAGLDSQLREALHPLPSWVVNWQADVFLGVEWTYFPYHLYTSMPNTLPLISVSFETLPKLNAAGFEVDSILTSFVLQRECLIDDVSTERILSLWKEHFTRYPTGYEPHLAWIRTLTRDLDVSDIDDSRLKPEQIIQHAFFSIFTRVYSREGTKVEEGFPRGIYPDLCRNGAVKEAQSFLDAAIATYNSSNFFFSKDGYMGVGPQALRDGDLICVLSGCQVPLLLRKQEDHHILVGPCFVWGLMDGEAMEKRQPGDEWETFHLR